MQSPPPHELLKKGTFDPKTGSVSGSIPMGSSSTPNIQELIQAIHGLKTELIVAYRSALERADLVIRLQMEMAQMRMVEAELRTQLSNTATVPNPKE